MFLMKISIIGFGAVGQGVAKAISSTQQRIKKKYNLKIDIVAAADSKGAAIREDGLDPQKLIEVKSEKGSVAYYPDHGHENIDGLQVLDEVEYDCLVEVTPTNIITGEPGKSLITKAMKDGKDVVTSNKGHLSLFYKELIDLARENNVNFKFEASVGGAMPIINFAQETLPSSRIESIIGILNGTTNFILSRMTAEGSSYEQTLKEAQELGIAETDPTQDVEGLDAACKSVILANAILGRECTLDDVEVTGITRITPEAIELAKEDGYHIKLIAEISHDILRVGPRLVKETSPYAVDGTLNMATLRTDLAGEITVIGKGAGSLETASAILTDIINIWKSRQS
ncbi:MAG: homoserine dehydrogenase [Methanobacteriaceae archaeon]|uniref:Homoserine dehydrogenase n=2 Tax=Methanothermobacter tenebrarum TaxID=680118 RepID=A0A328P931_9EURY|nr:homoserine dehydrogenase [Methanothermobacter tenebrarum]MBC7117438.1 homoserine dehydrogenase [Methanobacteriaceae archaeon]NPV64684.1 homoserine dehydrogenase [Methanobacteriaceae archaeon]RAO79018.1 homoserine dehydrogenase [Methanothermobacter tenebrarum]